MGLVTLDVRQESTKHTEAIDTITSYLGLGSYKEWDEAKRQEFLLKELTGKRPLLPPGAAPDRPLCYFWQPLHVAASPHRGNGASWHAGLDHPDQCQLSARQLQSFVALGISAGASI